jgi:hypothetical protein
MCTAEKTQGLDERAGTGEWVVEGIVEARVVGAWVGTHTSLPHWLLTFISVVASGFIQREQNYILHNAEQQSHQKLQWTQGKAFNARNYRF